MPTWTTGTRLLLQRTRRVRAPTEGRRGHVARACHGARRDRVAEYCRLPGDLRAYAFDRRPARPLRHGLSIPRRCSRSRSEPVVSGVAPQSPAGRSETSRCTPRRLGIRRQTGQLHSLCAAPRIWPEYRIVGACRRRARHTLDSSEPAKPRAIRSRQVPAPHPGDYDRQHQQYRRRTCVGQRRNQQYSPRSWITGAEAAIGAELE